MDKIKLVMAKTHPSEYLLHKYWARKPHNVISYFISQLVPNGGLVVDPFCGSGVVLRESQNLGIDVIGFDINPIANLISDVLINPPEEDKFINEVNKLLDDLEEKISIYYTSNDKMIKYLIHKIVVKCQCGNIVPLESAIKKERTYLCPNCNAKIRFNLENLIDTKITSIALENNSKLITCQDVIILQNKYSNTNILYANVKNYDYEFTENRRILAFSGMKTSSLFTKRNFSILCYLSDKIDHIDDLLVRNAVRLLLTASVAQCSRLIPARNNLSTGGPAWSVPGFWIPSEHLETNPLVHLRARFAKLIKGIRILSKNRNNSRAAVIKNDANKGIEDLITKNVKADLVFFDPPYGDSIPYLEFSSMWNSFLKDFPDPSIDISVSDRLSKTESWSEYSKSINRTLNNIANLLKEHGKLLITFNNHDLKAWEALIGALQCNKFSCKYVTYQIPAVISSKAQFSVKGSYVSDIYSIFSVDKKSVPSNSLEPVVNSLIKCASSRGGTILKNLAQRVAMITWMDNNIHADLLKEKNNLIKSLFNEKNGKLTLKDQIKEPGINIVKLSRKLAEKILKEGPCEWVDLYLKISKDLVEYGLPSPAEVRSYLDGYVVFDNKKCFSYISKIQT